MVAAEADLLSYVSNSATPTQGNGVAVEVEVGDWVAVGEIVDVAVAVGVLVNVEVLLLV
jgi:hypothetical protein